MRRTIALLVAMLALMIPLLLFQSLQSRTGWELSWLNLVVNLWALLLAAEVFTRLSGTRSRFLLPRRTARNTAVAVAALLVVSASIALPTRAQSTSVAVSVGSAIAGLLLAWALIRALGTSELEADFLRRRRSPHRGARPDESDD